MGGLRHVLRTLKHHVLEEMSESGSSLALVARPNVVINRDRHGRHGLVPAQHHAESVRKRKLLDWCLWESECLWHFSSRFARTMIWTRLSRGEDKTFFVGKPKRLKVASKLRRSTWSLVD